MSNPDPYLVLAAALLLRAMRDAQGCDPVLRHEARRWLFHSELSRALLDLFELQPDEIETALRRVNFSRRRLVML